jgi:prolyl oligopeptidase
MTWIRLPMRAACRLFPVLLLVSPPAFAANAGGYGYPQTAIEPVVETRFGIEVADPYRWLENDVRSDARVRDWVDRENAATSAYLATLPGRDILKARMRTLTDFERLGVPRKAGNRYFYTRNDGLQNQSVLWVRDGLAGPARILINPNGWARDGGTALGEWAASDDGRMLAFAVQDGGTDWRTLKLLDVDSGRTLDDNVEWVKFSQIAWAADGSGFYYSRFPAPVAGQDYQSANLGQSVWFHRVGTAQAEDRLIYATPDRPLLGHRAQMSDDGRWLLIVTSAGTDARYELHAIDLARPDARPITLVKGLQHNWVMIGNVRTRFYFVTNKDAPRQRIVAIDLERPRRRPMPIVLERAQILVGASMVGTRIVLSYLGDAKSDAEMVNLDGSPAEDVRLPGIGTATGFAGKAGDPETFYSFSGYTSPPTIYRFDTATGVTELFAKPRLAFEPSAFETVQHFYTSKDGTRIPIFVIRRKGPLPPGGAPTLLYGYGGFNASQTPGFSPTRLAWIEQGGVFAIASLRGGGEYGKAWHDAGRLQNKQNVFDDFIAAGEYLIAAGIAAPGKLAAEGRSNGGLLVGAVVNQRPDLFAAALPAVGVMDMLRFDRFTAGRYWMDDYGDPAKEADFRTLHAYSPYHNIRSGVDYPAILVTTADTDDRVVPGHSFKYAARLQASDIGDKPHLIRIETRAGHGSGKPTAKLLDESADVYAFAAKWTGLAIAERKAASGEK